jgi:iron complex outermembrane receptor protein
MVTSSLHKNKTCTFEDLMKHTSLFTAALLSSAVSQVNAQTTDESKEFGWVEEVTVTAQRVQQNLQDVPVSLTALSSDDLTKRNINDLTQITQLSPTLQVGQDNTFAVRGIGSQIFSATVDPSVAMALDGVNLGRPFLGGQAFNDVASIEVLNGPQGLLFGKNASAGLINITTNKPVLDEFSGNVSTEFSTRNTPDDSTGLVTKGVVNIPLTEYSAMRINAEFADEEALTQNVFADTLTTDQDSERSGIKFKYLFDNNVFSAYVIADYNEESGQPLVFNRTLRQIGDPVDGFNNQGQPETFTSAYPDVLAEDGIVASEENFQFNANGLTRRDRETGGLQAEIGYILDNEMEIVNIAAWRYYDLEQDLDSDLSRNSDGIIFNDNYSSYDQVSNELRLIIPANDTLQGQVGLFYYNSEVDTDQNRLWVAPPFPSFVATGFPFCIGPGVDVQPGPPPACNVENTAFLGRDIAYELETTSFAAFGQFDFFVSDTLTLLAGARITQDEVDMNITQRQGNYFVPIQGPSGVNIQESQDVTNFSWKFGGQLQVSDDLMTYANIGQGYKAPGFNTNAQSIEDPRMSVEEEISTTAELGAKSTLLDGRLTLNVSLFHTEFEDYQLQAFNTQLQTFLISNAAEVTAQGAEVSLTYRPVEALTVSWNASFLDSTFDDFAGAECLPGVDQSRCTADGTFDASGESTPLAADLTSTLQATYDFMLGDSIAGFVSGNWYHRSDMNFSVAASDTELDAVDTLGLSAGLTFADSFTVTLFCRNCTDELVPTNIAYDAGDANDGIATTVQTWGVESMRNIGISLAYEF